MPLYEMDTVDLSDSKGTTRCKVGLVSSKAALSEFIADYKAERHRVCTALFSENLSREWSESSNFVGTGFKEMGAGLMSGNGVSVATGIGRILFGAAGGWLGLIDKDPFSLMTIGRIYPTRDPKTGRHYVCVHVLATA